MLSRATAAAAAVVLRELPLCHAPPAPLSPVQVSNLLVGRRKRVNSAAAVNYQWQLPFSAAGYFV